MKVGTVIRWVEYPRPQYGGEIKPRWFVYVGRTSLVSDPVNFYLPTTTTNPANLGSNYVEFKKEKYTVFEDDCYINLDERPYIIPEGKIIDDPDIEIMQNTLDNETMKKIYKCILNSDKYAPIDRCNIFNCFINDGIADIRPPAKLSGRKR